MCSGNAYSGRPADRRRNPGNISKLHKGGGGSGELVRRGDGGGGPVVPIGRIES